MRMIAVSLLCVYVFFSTRTTGQVCDGPKRGIIYGTAQTGQADFTTIGFFFPFHGSGQNGGICSADIPTTENIQLLEMARYTLVSANIPGLRIALEAFDSCYSDQVAVEQSVRYLNDRISVTERASTCPDGSFKPGIIAHGAGNIGPTIAAFLSDAQVPIVSYAATQSQLTDDDEYSYFLRTIPSDKDEATAMAEVLLSLGWTYVSVIYSEALDDASAMESFKNAAKRSNICISQSASFPADAIDAIISISLFKLLSDTMGGPNVVVIFASPMQAKLILSNSDNTMLNVRAGNIQWVVGQHVLSDTSVLNPLPLRTTRGIVGIIPDDLVKLPTDGFETYFKGLRPDVVNPSENPWFAEFWQEAYQCNLPGSTKYPVPCSATHETQHANSKIIPHTQLVSIALNNFLRSLQAAQVAKCGATVMCAEFHNMPSHELLDYIKGIGYKPSGDPQMVKFAVQNYKRGSDGSTYSMTTVGSWEDSLAGPSLNAADLELWSNNQMVPTTSKCGSDCNDESCFQLANVTKVYRNGDIILGGMFSVHQPNGEQCGEINERGVQRLEAMLFALDKLNQDNAILPGITLGVEGFDTCGIPAKAGHLALQFSASGDFGVSGSGERFGPDGLPEHIYAVIGPETNEECEIVSRITNVYELPILGYAADSAVLSNVYNYPNFARVIPPSQTQASAMIELIYREGWKYMHILYSDNNYGLYGANTAQSLGISRDVCTTNKLVVPADNSQVQWDKIFDQLDQHLDARVLVLFLEERDLRNLFTQLTMHNRVGLYFIVSCDLWPTLYNDFLTEFPNLVKGINIVKTQQRDFTEFRNHFANLRPNSNMRNPWFAEYWESKFQCSLDGEEGMPLCGDSNTLNADELNDKYIAEVIDSVFVVARGLDDLQKTLCSSNTRVCLEMSRASGADLWLSIIQQRFNSINQDHNLISFNNLGDGTPVYDIYNYQSEVNHGPFDFVKIGHFLNYMYTGGIDNNRLKVYDEQGLEIASPQSVCSGPCHDCQKADEGTTAEIKDGDVWLGGFFRLHTIGPDKLTCTDELVLYNMQLLEAFLFAIESINNDPYLLPNIKLGAIAFDTCGSEARAQREAANFITAKVEYRGGYFTNRLTVSGIIGEETSDTTLALAETVTPLKVSQISYAATSTKLDDHEKYPYFMRTVASDSQQATAILDILDKFNWKYVSVVYSDNEFGNDLYDNIKKQIDGKETCIGFALKVLSNFVDSDFSTIIKELQFNPQTKVVLLLTSDLHTKALLNEAEKQNVVDLQWVGGNTWGLRQDVIEHAPLTASGSIVLKFHSQLVPGFREYFTNRPTYTNLRNPWWKQYISDFLQCNLPTTDIPAKYEWQCPWDINIDSVYQEAPEVQYVVSAVNIFAVGLQFAMDELCPNITSYVCQKVLENPDVLNRHIKSSGFQLPDGSFFQFDQLGNGPANYEILNVQRVQDKVTYTQVGTWKSGILNLYEENVKFYNGNTLISSSPTQCQGRCSECREESDTTVEFLQVPGQIQIPGLFAIHETGDHRVECGDVRQSGILNMEAFLYALQAINDDSSLLPNVKVGTTAFDTCMSESRGVRELSGLLSGTMNFAKEERLPGTFSTIVGVLGAESEAVTQDTAVLSGQYKYAQVSYGMGRESTLNDPYLLQAGPSYTGQARAVAALVKVYGWQYISVVHGADSAFYQGAADFLQVASAENLCVATNQMLPPTGEDLSQVITNLIQRASDGARVVVVFSSSSDIQAMLSAVGTATHLTWILAFPESIKLSDLIKRTADNDVLRGALTITPTETMPSDFEQHLLQLNRDASTANPWLKEIGPFSPADILEHGQMAGYIIDATYAIAHGMHNLLGRLCPNKLVCTDFLAATPEEFYSEIEKVSFIGINSQRFELSHGNLVQRYKVSNYQKTGESYTMVEVGSWKSGDELPILANSVRLYDGVNVVDNIDSSCPSSLGCATCVLPPTGLPPIPPPVNTKSPLKQPAPSSNLGSLWFIILVIISAIGVIVAAAVIFVLVWRWDEPITRTISPFLCLVILIGIILLYGVTPIFAAPVSNKIICALQRVFPGIAWSVCFSGVFLQVMRHWRIARRERRITGAKVSFVNNTSQVVLFLFFLAFQCILAVQWLIFQPPSLIPVLPENSPSSEGPTATTTVEAILECAYTKQSMVTYCIFIYAILVLSIIVSTVARRYAHVISIVELNTLLVCNLVNGAIMAAWVVVLLLIEKDVHRPATSAAAASTATATLIILFTYRVKVLFRNHDPFVDSASVASGEYFTGTINRLPQRTSFTERVYDVPPNEVPGIPLSDSAVNGSTSSLKKYSKTTGF